MVFQPTAEFHPEASYHQHFQMADSQDGYGCCGCWRIFRRKPKEYFVNQEGQLVGKRNCKYRERIVANKRLCELIKYKLDPEDTEEADRLFEELKRRINNPMTNSEPITSERLAQIIIIIDELKNEIRK